MVGRVRVDLLAGLVRAEHLGGHRGAGAGADRVGGHAHPAEPARRGQGERGDAALGRGVVGLAGRPAQERLRGGVDDPPVDRSAGLLRPRAPVRRGVAREQEVAAQVHLEHQVPLLVAQVEQHPVAGDAGVVDHDVELAELRRAPSRASRRRSTAPPRRPRRRRPRRRPTGSPRRPRRPRRAGRSGRRGHRRRASASASARPRPAPAPVTTATRPSRDGARSRGHAHSSSE